MISSIGLRLGPNPFEVYGSLLFHSPLSVYNLATAISTHSIRFTKAGSDA